MDTQQLEYNSPCCARHRWGLQLLEMVAQQPAKMLCMEEAAFSAPIMGLCNWLHIYTGLVAASVTILGRQSCVVLPILGCWCKWQPGCWLWSVWWGEAEQLGCWAAPRYWPLSKEHGKLS